MLLLICNCDLSSIYYLKHDVIWFNLSGFDFVAVFGYRGEILQTGKTTAIRRAAVRGVGASLGIMGAQLRVPTALSYRGV